MLMVLDSVALVFKVSAAAGFCFHNYTTFKQAWSFSFFVSRAVLAVVAAATLSVMWLVAWYFFHPLKTVEENVKCDLKGFLESVSKLKSDYTLFIDFCFGKHCVLLQWNY